MDHILVYALRRYPPVCPPYGDRIGLFGVSCSAYLADLRYRVRAPVNERHDLALVIVPHYIFYQFLKEGLIFHVPIMLYGELSGDFHYLRGGYIELGLGKA